LDSDFSVILYSAFTFFFTASDGLLSPWGSGYKNFKTINTANADPGIAATAAGLSSST
jgi:hypothetical protein